MVIPIFTNLFVTAVAVSSAVSSLPPTTSTQSTNEGVGYYMTSCGIQVVGRAVDSCPTVDDFIDYKKRVNLATCHEVGIAIDSPEPFPVTNPNP